MKKYLNKKQYEFFRIAKNTLAYRVESGIINDTLYLNSLEYLKNFIYKNYKISKKDTNNLVYGISRIFEFKKIFKNGKIIYNCEV